MKLGSNFTARLILAIFSTALEEVAIYAIWRWVLPRIDVYIPLYAVITLMVLWGTYAVTNFVLVTRALRKKAYVGLPSMIGSTGKIAKAISRGNPEGLVRIKGELWAAESIDGNTNIDEQVEVVGEEGLRLKVRRKSTGEKK